MKLHSSDKLCVDAIAASGPGPGLPDIYKKTLLSQDIKEITVLET